MKHLHQPTTVDEVKARIARVTPASERQWGRMTAAQALAHCAATLSDAVGDTRPPRQLAGRLFGRLAKSRVLSDAPLGRNAPTAPGLRITDARDLDVERARLCALIDRFATGGPAACTTHPHSFFGPLTPQEWAAWMYKHLDHHLRQFQA